MESPSIRVRHARRALAVAGVAMLAAVLAAPAIAGTGIGAVFNLGRTNVVNAPSTLTGSSASGMLKVANSGNGVALQLTTKSTVPPMKVNSSVKVANLNADRLDGIDSSGFVQPSGDILVSAGNGNWSPMLWGSSLEESRTPGSVNFTSPAPSDTTYLVVSPDLPVALYGKSVELRAVDICFSMVDASMTGVYLTRERTYNTAEIQDTLFADATVYLGADCHRYTLATPTLLTPNDSLSFALNINFSLGGYISIFRTTFILGATSTPAVLSPSTVIVGGPSVALPPELVASPVK